MSKIILAYNGIGLAMLFMKVMIALPDDKLEESIVNAGCQYIIIICYQVFSHKNNFFLTM